MPENPPAPTVPTTPISSSSSQDSSSFSRTLLIGVVLILLGTLLGVLAARFLPMTTNTLIPLPPITLTPTVIEPILTPTIEITPIPTPTATPSALLSLKWNMMTVKSPLTAFSDYKIYYPTTWTIKEYKNTPGINDSGSVILALTKGKNTMTISSETATYLCDKQSLFNINKETIIWDIQESSPSAAYQLCEEGNGAEPPVHIGSVTLTGTSIDNTTLDEFKYILEKIVILGT